MKATNAATLKATLKGFVMVAYGSMLASLFTLLCIKDYEYEVRCCVKLSYIHCNHYRKYSYGVTGTVWD